MPERIDGGRALAAIGGLVLAVSLFLEWFPPSRDAWTIFEIADLILAAIAVAAIASALDREPAVRMPRPALLWLGLVALAIVAEALINPPPGAIGRSPQAGAWVGLIGAALIAAGGALSTSRVAVVVTLRSTAPPDRAPPPPAAHPVDPPAPGPEADETATRPLPRGRRKS
jgi:hypothetical protein